MVTDIPNYVEIAQKTWRWRILRYIHITMSDFAHWGGNGICRNQKNPIRRAIFRVIWIRASRISRWFGKIQFNICRKADQRYGDEYDKANKK